LGSCADSLLLGAMTESMGNEFPKEDDAGTAGGGGVATVEIGGAGVEEKAVRKGG